MAPGGESSASSGGSGEGSNDGEDQSKVAGDADVGGSDQDA